MLDAAPRSACSSEAWASRTRPVSERNPFLVERMQGFRHDDLRRDVGARRRPPASINLGQGFPDTDGPPEVVEAAIAAIRAGDNQYPPGIGIAALRAAVAEHQSRFWGLDVRPRRGGPRHRRRHRGDRGHAARAARAGRRGGHVRAVLRLLRRVHRARGRARGASSRCARPTTRSRLDALARRDHARDQLVAAQLAAQSRPARCSRAPSSTLIAALCVEHDLVAVTDEVYEHLVYDGEHIPLATLPGMRDRTVTISSAGKTFSMTGWKTGWVCASGAARRRGAHGEAVPDLRARRRRSSTRPRPGCACLTRTSSGSRPTSRRSATCSRPGSPTPGSTVFLPSGTYFVTADIRPFGETDGMAFCRALPGAVRGGGGPDGRLLRRRRGRRRRSCASRSASVARCSKRPSSA